MLTGVSVQTGYMGKNTHRYFSLERGNQPEPSQRRSSVSGGTAGQPKHPPLTESVTNSFVFLQSQQDFGFDDRTKFRWKQRGVSQRHSRNYRGSKVV